MKLCGCLFLISQWRSFSSDINVFLKTPQCSFHTLEQKWVKNITDKFRGQLHVIEHQFRFNISTVQWFPERVCRSKKKKKTGQFVMFSNTDQSINHNIWFDSTGCSSSGDNDSCPRGPTSNEMLRGDAWMVALLHQSKECILSCERLSGLYMQR